MTRLLPLVLAVSAAVLVHIGGCQGPEPAGPAGAAANAAPTPIEHTLFDEILRAHVKEGMVDYRTLQAKDAGKLQEYLRSLALADPTAFKGPDDELAFWLNAYNAFVIAGVLEHYPGLEKVQDLPDFFKDTRWSAAGQLYSLNEIENEIIRPEFGDPRIHFILVCAAQSCPPLQAGAMIPETLQADLDRATREAVNNAKYVLVDADAGVLRLTRIMSWYQKDFVEKDGSLEAFLLRYLEEPARSQVEGGEHTIEFMAYDWTLNDLS